MRPLQTASFFSKGAILFFACGSFLSCEKEERVSEDDPFSPKTSQAKPSKSAMVRQKADTKSDENLARQIAVRNKLNGIILPRVNFDNTSLDEALEYFTQKSLESDEDGERGISFVSESSGVTKSSSDYDIDEDLGGGDLLLGDDPSTEKIPYYSASDIPFGRAMAQSFALCGRTIYLEKSYLLILEKGQTPPETAVPLWDSQLEEIEQAKNQKELEEKLDTIIVPRIHLEETEIAGALAYLSSKSIELDPTPLPWAKGIGMVVYQKTPNPRVDWNHRLILYDEEEGQGQISILMDRNLSLRQALYDSCAAAGYEVFVGESLHVVRKGEQAEDHSAIPLTRWKSSQPTPDMIAGWAKILRERLEQIVLAEVNFENAALEEVMEYCAQKAIEFDPEPDPARKGIGFMIGSTANQKKTPLSPEKPDQGADLLLAHESSFPLINFQGQDLSLGAVIHEVSQQAGFDVYLAGKVLLIPKGKKPEKGQFALPYQP